MDSCFSKSFNSKKNEAMDIEKKYAYFGGIKRIINTNLNWVIKLH